MSKVLIKTICIFTVLLLVAGTFTACGNKTTENAKESTVRQESSAVQTTTQEEKKEPVKLTLWNSTVEGVDNGYKAIIEAYKAINPNVDIEFSSFPGTDYDSKMKTAFTGGTGPDIFFTTGWNNLQTYVDSGIAEPLDGKIDTSLFTQDAIDVESIQGKLYGGMGATAQYLTVFYNKDLFTQAGVNVPKTYTEFINLCETLKSKKITPISMGGQEAAPYIFQWLTIGQAMSPDYFSDIQSGKVATFKDPRYLKVFNAMIDWGKAGYYQNGFKGTTYAAQKILFATGKAAMLFTGIWDYAEIKGQNANINMGAFAFPGDSKIYGIRVASSGLSVNSKSPNKEEAIKFVNFTCTLEAQKLMVDATQGIPLVKELEISDPVMKEAADAPEYANFYNIPMNIAGANKSNPQDVFANNFMKVTNGEMTVEQLAELMDKAWDPAKYVELFKK